MRINFMRRRLVASSALTAAVIAGTMLPASVAQAAQAPTVDVQVACGQPAPAKAIYRAIYRASCVDVAPARAIYRAIYRAPGEDVAPAKAIYRVSDGDVTLARAIY